MTSVVHIERMERASARARESWEKRMKSSLLALITLSIIWLGACASQEEPAVEPASTSDASAAIVVADPGESSAERTERRLQLERALDQWWMAFQRQEYAKSDGVASALEAYVNKNYEAVVADLQTASPRFRKVAAAALGFAGRKESIPPLVEALHDTFSDVVFGSLLSLWRLALQSEDMGVPADEVVPYLSHVDAGIRSNAALVLAHATRKGQGELFLPLTAAMEDSDPSVRVHAAAALGALGDADAIPFLAKGLKDPKALVRIRSAYALGRIGDRRAVAPLIERLDDPDEDVSKAAHKALTTITGQHIPRVRADWETYHKEITD